MPQTFDLILKGGIVVNHDGRVERDIGVRGGRIAAIGDLSQASAEREIDCRGLHILPGVIDTPGAFPRARPRPQGGSRNRAPAPPSWAASRPCSRCPTPIRRPRRPRRSPTRCGAAITACIATSPSGSAARTRMPSDVPELERLPGAAGIKVFMGSSTGSLLVEDDEGIANILRRTRRRAAFHSEDEAMLRERKDLRVEGDPRSHPVWRSAEVALACTQRLVRIARETGARIHVLHITTAEEMALLKDHKDRRVGRGHAASPDPRGTGGLRAPRHLHPDEPAGARRAAPRRRSGRGSTRASPTSSAPITRRIRARRRTRPIPTRPRA